MLARVIFILMIGFFGSVRGEYEEELFLVEEEEWAIPKKTYPGYRNYLVPADEDDKKDIRFILKTMSSKPPYKLWKYKSELEKAGDRVDDVHPLRFLSCVFTDEELKVYIHNIKRKGGIAWGEFFKGLKGSLQEESSIGNLKEWMVDDFSLQVNIDIKLIEKLIKELQWEEFVKTLIINIPREGDSGRYGL